MKLIKKLETRYDCGHRRRWGLFECEYCGNIIEKRFEQGIKSKSCGCASFLKANIKHNMSKTRQYKIWSDMKDRCDNPNNKRYFYYGQRGISYNPSWSEFINFWNDMKYGYQDNLTIDRIDSNKNYYKENCQWITLSENSSKSQKKNTLKIQDINTYNRKITLKELLPYIDEYKKAKHGSGKIIIEKLSKDFNLSIGTAKVYLINAKYDNLDKKL